MKAIGIVATIVAVVLAGAAAFVAVRSAPDVARYRRIRAM